MPSKIAVHVLKSFVTYHEPMPYAGITVCAAFFLGLLALAFAPDTRGKPLRE